MVFKFILFFYLILTSSVAFAFQDTVNNAFGAVNSVFAKLLFFDVFFFLPNITVPFAVFWLIIGGVYFTIRMGFINVRAFYHAIQVTRGRFSDPEDEGEVSHFEALTTALSATVGLGNIAGVAIAISLGGPGATFWMILAGLIGMSSKFTECTLGQMYREVRPNGQVMGGPMEYLKKGLAEVGYKKLGSVLSVVFALMCIGGSLGGGTSFQVNQSLNAVKETFPIFAQYDWLYGIVFTILTALVLLGGIKRIAQVAEAIVPSMCGIYVSACLFILFKNFSLIPDAIVTIFSSAFSPDAAYGGIIGVLVIGFKRAAFSNEAGIGSASIAHSAAKSKYPVREGVVSLLEPFIDTVVVCTMTALVIIITGVYNNPEYANLIAQNQGAALTSAAMGTQISWFPYVLSVSVILFAFSTIISWSYYGERCFSFLFGEKRAIIYKIILLSMIFLGSITTATNVLDFGDLMILGMSIPNILGMYFLSKKVKVALREYWSNYKSGKMRIYR